MDNGWIKLHRKFSDWEWYNISEMVHLFVHLLVNANHKYVKWRGVDIERGQILTGLHSLSSATGISIQKIRTCLKRLESTKEIIVKSTNKYSIITICNYDSYQSENIQPNKQLTNNQQTTNKQLTTNKNDKNDKNDKNYIIKLAKIENLLKKNMSLETCLSHFDKWKDYLAKQHEVIIQDNEYGLEILIEALERVGATKIKESIDFSIISMYKKIYAKKEPNPPQNLRHLNQAAKKDSDY